jgi:hypothetical protein
MKKTVRYAGSPPETLEEHRARARHHGTLGIGFLGRALDAVSEPETRYRYSPEVQARFQELGVEIVRLIEDGEIVDAADSIPPSVYDVQFRHFLNGLIKPPRPPKRKKA